MDDALGDEAEALIEAVEQLGRRFSSFDEIEYLGAFNEAIEELVVAEAAGPWALLWELWRAWPPELFGQLLAQADPVLHAILERIDEPLPPAELLALDDSGPAGLLARLVA
jgi:hypothetical protein